MADDPAVSLSAKRVKLFVYADAFGLTRDERIGLAEMILRRDIGSWKNLTDAQVDRMLDALEGCALVMHLMQQRSPVHGLNRV